VKKKNEMKLYSNEKFLSRAGEELIKKKKFRFLKEEKQVQLEFY